MMSPEQITLLMFGLLVFGLFLGHPLAFVLGGTAVIAAYLGPGTHILGILVSRIFGDVVDNYTLIAIPLFILMARFLADSGVTDRMFDTLRKMLSGVPGGLALAVVFISILLAATTGIIGASITVMSVIAINPMLRYGYSPSLTAGTIMASGSLGILIPPSIMLILMASYSPVSVGALFSGALLPGIILGLFYALWVGLVALVRPDMAPRSTLTESEASVGYGRIVLEFVIEALPTLLLIFGILGTLIAGIATATEASAIGAMLALLIVLVRGRFTWRSFVVSLLETGRTSAMILFIVIGATAFTGVFNISGGLNVVQDFMRNLDLSDWATIAIMLAIVFVLGAFLDWTGIVLLSFPIFLPIVQEMDIDLLWFIVMMAVVLQSSFLTPPFGYALFYMRAMAPPEMLTSHILLGVLPFIGLIILTGVLLVVFPSIITWLPNQFY